MIRYERTTLENGLRVLVHYDPESPLAALNILYDVGSKDEHPEKTGFAHLFEHLMFGGSGNIPSYDTPLQRVGGENNAFTNTDITNYYLSLPAENLETGLWLESDRMLELDFSERSLNVQRNVVVEEFKQRYLNQPYGDAILLLRPLAYHTHPYRWPTIGKEISHIQDACLEDVKNFFYSHYAPNNAILVLAGNIPPEKAFERIAYWFGEIEKRPVLPRQLPQEPVQTEAREQTVVREVPYDALYLAYHMPGRNHPDYPAYDLLSDILGGGKSSRLYRTMVMEKKLFSEINAYVSGETDPGLLMISGKLIDGIKAEKGKQALLEELEQLMTTEVSTYELDKVKNKIEADLLYAETDILSRAINLASYEYLGDASLIHTIIDQYRGVNGKKIREISRDVFRPSNSSTLFYLRKNRPSPSTYPE